MNSCCLILESEPGSGPWNMAVDEALLMSAVEQGFCTVRIYCWEEPTVSLGYFQPADVLQNDIRFARLPAVRRLSGGGAILHHHEITYSCAVPAGHPAAEFPTDLYELVHRALVDVLMRRGIPAVMRGKANSAANEAFLCFSRGDPRDVLYRGCKILGSAQRRRSGAVLQHGSLLLRRSEHAPEHPGVFDLAEHSADGGEIEAALGAEIAMALSGHVERRRLPDAERRLAARLAGERYRRLDWRRRDRAPSGRSA